MSPRKAKERKLVFWAVDPFEKDALPAGCAVQELGRWAGSLGARVQPLYLAAPAVGKVTPVTELQKMLDAYVKREGLESALPARVVLEEGSSRAGELRNLAELAEREGVLAIALSSHGRAGLGRLVLGSFAEGLLRESKVPVCFLARSARCPTEGAGAVLFATDFSPNSQAAFRALLASGALSGRSLALLHLVTFPVPYGSEATVYAPTDYLAERTAWAKGEAAKWIEEARNQDCKVTLLVRDGGAGFATGAGILKAAADLGAGLVALASTSGPLDRALFGSAAYDVFRDGSRLVLVYGPGALREASDEA